MEITRTFDLLDLYREKYRMEDALAGKEKGIWVRYSSDQYIDFANNVSYGLLALGLKKGDMVATISNNRPEWNFVDMGVSQAGIIHVPVYPTISKEEYEYILNDSKPSVIFLSDKALYDKIKPIADNIESVKEVYTFNEVEGAKNWTEVVELGKKSADQFMEELEKIKASVKPEDFFTLLYTSGTTGFPKGVQLCQNNVVSNFKAIAEVHNLGHGDKTLSFLPISHIYERMVNYHFQYLGIAIYYAENMGTIVDNVKEIKPEIFLTVPRLLERVYDKIMGKGKDLKGIKKSLFFWAVNLGLRFELNRANGWVYHLKLKIADKLIFSKWREALGGNVKIIVSGSAALQPRLARVFCAAGMNVLEGYGLTETSPVIAANNLVTNEMMFGTVGPVVSGGVEVKIAEDGEILCKGPNVMMGYYNQPELTREVLTEDGWFHTGDIGEFVDGKYLKITDRKKEMFKLSSGKYIAPQVIENKMKESFFIEQAMVVGENEKFASALISPNFPFLHEWATRHNIKFTDNEELIGRKDVNDRIQEEVQLLNKDLGEHERIKRIRLIKDEWTPESGHLSPTAKLKRRKINESYESIITEIYSVGKGEIDFSE
ncbi:AMP-dependent synthetase/ligase [Bacteroidota bacterium]